MIKLNKKWNKITKNQVWFRDKKSRIGKKRKIIKTKPKIKKNKKIWRACRTIWP
jgi:hypothetical protein